YEKELKEKSGGTGEVGGQEFLSETEKQFLMKYDIEVPTTLLKEEVLERQRKMNGGSVEEGGGDAHHHVDVGIGFDDLSSYAGDMTSPSAATTSTSRPILKRSEGSANLLLHPFSFDTLEEKNDEGKGGEEEEEEENNSNNNSNDNNTNDNINYFNPTKQNIIQKVVDFSVENKKDKDRLKAIFSNKTFLTETKSLPVSMFISKPDIDDIDIDLDDDPELLQLKLEQENFKNDNISKKVFEREMEQLMKQQQQQQQQQQKDEMGDGEEGGDGHDTTKDGSSHKKSGKKGSGKNGYKGDFIKRNIQLGGDARYYYALTDEEKIRLEAILQLPDEELDTTSAFTGGGGGQLAGSETKEKSTENHEGDEKNKGKGKDKENQDQNQDQGQGQNQEATPKEILVNPDDYIKNDARKTLKNGFLPSVEEFDTLKKINE
ncbi:hypothetical protein PIROE2DRAFT_9506, partial [Piromyces sp. E2]